MTDHTAWSPEPFHEILELGEPGNSMWLHQGEREKHLELEFSPNSLRKMTESDFILFFLRGDLFFLILFYF